LANFIVGKAVLQLAGSTGAFQRNAPTGGAAKGIPSQKYVPDAAVSSIPSTGPNWVDFDTGELDPPPPPPHPASASKTNK
jgi:hypothetical protein